VKPPRYNSPGNSSSAQVAVLFRRFERSLVRIDQQLAQQRSKTSLRKCQGLQKQVMAKRMAFLKAVARAIGIRPQKHWPGWKAVLLREGTASLPQPLSGKLRELIERSILQQQKIQRLSGQVENFIQSRRAEYEQELSTIERSWEWVKSTSDLRELCTTRQQLKEATERFLTAVAPGFNCSSEGSRAKYRLLHEVMPAKLPELHGRYVVLRDAIEDRILVLSETLRASYQNELSALELRFEQQRSSDDLRELCAARQRLKDKTKDFLVQTAPIFSHSIEVTQSDNRNLLYKGMPTNFPDLHGRYVELCNAIKERVTAAADSLQAKYEYELAVLEQRFEQQKSSNDLQELCVIRQQLKEITIGFVAQVALAFSFSVESSHHNLLRVMRIHFPVLYQRYGALEGLLAERISELTDLLRANYEEQLDATQQRLEQQKLNRDLRECRGTGQHLLNITLDFLATVVPAVTDSMEPPPKHKLLNTVMPAHFPALHVRYVALQNSVEEAVRGLAEVLQADYEVRLAAIERGFEEHERENDLQLLRAIHQQVRTITEEFLFKVAPAINYSTGTPLAKAKLFNDGMPRHFPALRQRYVALRDAIQYRVQESIPVHLDQLCSAFQGSVKTFRRRFQQLESQASVEGLPALSTELQTVIEDFLKAAASINGIDTDRKHWRQNFLNRGMKQPMNEQVQTHYAEAHSLLEEVTAINKTSVPRPGRTPIHGGPSNTGEVRSSGSRERRGKQPPLDRYRVNPFRPDDYLSRRRTPHCGA
jgi:hypothetical protein